MARRSNAIDHDYTGRAAGRARRDRATTALAVLIVSAVAGLTSCGCGSSPASQPSTATEAYASAHPSQELPTTLHTVNLSREQVGRRIAGIVGDRVRVVLPRRLPPGFKLAVPYIAVGDGTARPNPEGWGKSYRVSYTDGWGLVMMTYGAARLPDGVIWHENGLRIDGRPARAGVAGEAVVVATDDGRPLVVVIGRNAPPEQVLACAESLAPWR